VDQFIREGLAGERFALTGFEELEAASIISALATVRGFGHVVGGASSIPGLNSLAPFDACFVNASAGAGEQPHPLETIARNRKPAVIVGTFEELVAQIGAIADPNRDFIVRPYEPEELLLRAYRILRFVERAAGIQASAPGGVRRVLLADDDRTTIVLVSSILKHFHFEC
jgi:hypothetical protein